MSSIRIDGESLLCESGYYHRCGRCDQNLDLSLITKLEQRVRELEQKNAELQDQCDEQNGLIGEMSNTPAGAQIASLTWERDELREALVIVRDGPNCATADEQLYLAVKTARKVLARHEQPEPEEPNA